MEEAKEATSQCESDLSQANAGGLDPSVKETRDKSPSNEDSGGQKDDESSSPVTAPPPGGGKSKTEEDGEEERDSPTDNARRYYSRVRDCDLY